MLVEILMKMGFEPKIQTATSAKYISPFRNERTASFYVFPNRTTGEMTNWKDHGSGDGGDMYKFLMVYYQIGFVEAKRKLEEMDISIESSRIFSPNQQKKEDVHTVEQIRPLGISSTKYLADRGLVDTDLQEIVYTFGLHRYYAVCFQNRAEGYEVRNPYFKGTIGKKDISVLGSGSTLKVFEGFLDYYSYLALVGATDATVIVLNGVSSIGGIYSYLRDAREIHLYMDIDRAGDVATRRAYIMGFFSRMKFSTRGREKLRKNKIVKIDRIEDKRRLYVAGARDVNEMLVRMRDGSI